MADASKQIESTEVEQQDDSLFYRFLDQQRALSKTIAVKTIYIDMTGDLIAGILLGQIIYWHDCDENGRPRTRVKKHGRECIAKQKDEWWDEIRITLRQVERALVILRKKRLIRTQNFRFNGLKTMHIFLNKKRFLLLINQQLTRSAKSTVLTKAQNRNYPKRRTETTQSAEPLTDSTTENTKNNNKRTVAASSSLKKSLKLKSERWGDFSIPKSLHDKHAEGEREAAMCCLENKEEVQDPAAYYAEILRNRWYEPYLKSPEDLRKEEEAVRKDMVSVEKEDLERLRDRIVANGDDTPEISDLHSACLDAIRDERWDEVQAIKREMWKVIA